MAVIKKIYKKEYKVGSDRYVYFCERQVDPDFQPVGFNVKGKVRDYMLIPMFYGSIDGNGRMRSIAGQWSCLTASGSSSDNSSGTAIGTTEQNTAIFENECKRVILRRPAYKYVSRYLCNAYAKHRFTKFFWKRNVLQLCRG